MTMHHFRKIRRTLAVFFVINFLSQICYPTISYALTAGPTAPEFSSFEPVDTTDMVNLATGDFTYNIPLIEVPGPAGGYPLSLSYHAGIQPDQEASWTGLGFTLNPGSITRLVNGYPDDHNGVTNVSRSFWEGGEQVTTTVGLSYGLPMAASVSAGLTFAQDTYRGRGVGFYTGVSLGVDLNKTVRANANITVGSSPYGSPFSSAGISVGLAVGSNEGLNLSGSLGFSLNSNSGLNAGAGAGIGVGRQGSLLDASISSNSTKPSLGLGGMTSDVFNGMSNNMSINAEGFQIDVPVYPGINIRLGRNYQRYWIDETTGIHTFGTLYMGDVPPNFSNAFDTYDLLDTSLDIADNDNPEKVLGGSFPDTDVYSVVAQGVSGNIKPYHFQQYLYRQDKKEGPGEDKILVKSYVLGNTPEVKPVEYRFINDFSNRLEYDPGNFQISNDQISFDFDGNIVTGKEEQKGFENNHLAGSKHIEWYSNIEILGGNPAQEGFISCVAQDFVRSADYQVGGFSITNSSGVTYHYALPVYSYAEFMKTVNSTTKQATEGLSYNTLSKPEKYAYTWLLTAVTGPDFVDRNENGLADHGDWGYWVNFEYKKWLSDYKWRNPGIGTNRDVDAEFEFYSSGKKEIYYLDKVITETHVALFEKSIRQDGREVMDIYEGGFDPKPILQKSEDELICYDQCEQIHCFQGSCNEEAYEQCRQQCDLNYEDILTGHEFPRSALKLDVIKLFNYNDFISARTSDDYVLRAVDFNHDYSLAEGTPNSYEESNFIAKTGRLTLKSLQFLGKKKVSLIPPTHFEYKNIPFELDKKDVWGYYKNDFDKDYLEESNNIIGRLTTASSAEDVDAWSLNEVKTPIGTSIKIKYESDSYDDVALAKQNILRVKEVTDFAQDKLKLTFWETGIDLHHYFSLGQTISVSLFGSYDGSNYNGHQCSGGNVDQLNNNIPAILSKLFNGNVTIDAIDSESEFIIVYDTDYYSWLKNETKTLTLDYNILEEVNDQPVNCTFQYMGLNAWPDYFPVGTVSVPEDAERFGGGIRVKEISLTNQLGDSRATSYQYTGGTTSYEPFEILEPKINPNYPSNADKKEISMLYKRSTMKNFYKQIVISRQLPGPGVMYKKVTVTEKSIPLNGEEFLLPNFAQYEFETFSSGMVDVLRGSIQKIANTNEEGEFESAKLNTVILKDFSGRVGNLKKITNYNSLTNEIVYQTINKYLHDDIGGTFSDNVSSYEPLLLSSFLNQGLTEETYTRARVVYEDYWEDNSSDYNLYTPSYQRNLFGNVIVGVILPRPKKMLLGTISKLETFPSIPIGQENTNYKTGVVSATENLAFDFFSGEPTEILTKDSYGNQYKSVTLPAYQKYPAMGLKVDNKANKNMLSQVTGQYSFLLNDQREPIGLLSANIQTWSNQVAILNGDISQQSIWRKQVSYSWNGDNELNQDGSYPYTDFLNNDFNWNSDSNPKWERGGEIMLYNTYSNALEAKDMNSNYASTRMNTDQTKVIASTSNARYGETAFSGAEYYNANTERDGGVDRGQGSPSNGHKHTGEYSLLVGSGKTGFNYTLTSGNADLTRRYKASVWVYAPGESESQQDLDKIKLYSVINEVKREVHPIIQKSKAKSWYLLSLDIDPNGAPVRIECGNSSVRSVYFDDFRVHPVDASMTSYVYDSFSGELTYILDNNNFYTKFEYDAMGRLIRTSKELLNFDYGEGKESFRADAILKEVKYNYGKSN